MVERLCYVFLIRFSQSSINVNAIDKDHITIPAVVFFGAENVIR